MRFLLWSFVAYAAPAPDPATVDAVRAAPDRVDAIVFLAPDSPVLPFVRDYLDALSAASEGRLEVLVVDHALVPELAEELRVRDNGYLVVRRGSVVEKERIREHAPSAGRDLAGLDGTVRLLVSAVVRERTAVYVLAGHGEAPLGRSFGDLVRARGLALATLDTPVAVVPADAAVVVVAAPRSPLGPDEDVLLDWLSSGGAVLALLEPGADPLPGLLSTVGVAAGDASLAHERAFVRVTGEDSDRGYVVTDRFGDHPAAERLRAVSGRGVLVFAGPLGLSAIGEPPASALAMPRDDTWADADGDFTRDATEAPAPPALALAASGEGGWRAVVVGDVAWAADLASMNVPNAALAVGVVEWLADLPEIPAPADVEPVDVPPVPDRAVPLVPEAPIDAVTWTADGLEVRVERQQDRLGPYVWVTVADAEGRASFLGNEAASQLLEPARWTAVREIHPAPGALGLDQPTARLRIVQGATSTDLPVGSATFGVQDWVVQAGERVVLLPDHPIRALREARIRLLERDLVAAEASAVHVETDGRPVRFRAAEAGELLDRLRRLRVREPVPEPPQRLERVARLTLVHDGAKERIDLLHDPDTDGWYARSDRHRATVAVHPVLAADLAEAARAATR